LFTLINIDSVETTGTMQGIVHPLVVPPFIRMIDLANIGVIGCSEKVDLGQVVGIAEMIHDASVEPGAAIRDIGMSMDIAPKKPEGLSVDLPFMTIEGRALGGFVRVWELLFVWGFTRFFGGGRRQRCRRGKGGEKDGGGLMGLVRALVGWPA
jgi:hypothetical protein